MSVPLFDQEAPLARHSSEPAADAFERQAPAQDDPMVAPPEQARRDDAGLHGSRAREPEAADAAGGDVEPAVEAPRRRGFFGRIGDFFSGLRTRFRNWRLRNSTSTEGSEILTRAVDEIKRTEGGQHRFAEEDVAGRLVRQGVRTEASGLFREKRSRFRERPMKQGVNPADAKRFWDLDFAMNNLGRREDEPVVHSKRHAPTFGGPGLESEAGRAMKDFRSEGRGAGGGHGLKWQAEMIGMRSTKAALQAARTGAAFNGLSFSGGPMSRAQMARKYGPKDWSSVVPEAAHEAMEEEPAIPDDQDAMEIDQDR